MFSRLTDRLRARSLRCASRKSAAVDMRSAVPPRIPVVGTDRVRDGIKWPARQPV
jgi:hypothetical protein